MESFEKNTFEAKKPENILNEWDREILHEGGKNVVKMMLKDFNNKLPDVIVLPDTSARPLYYLLKPLVEKLEKKKNIKKPNFQFVKTAQPPTFFGIKEKYHGKNFESKEEIEDYFNQRAYEIIENNEEDTLEWNNRSRVAVLDEIKESNILEKRKNLQQRGSEIKKTPTLQ
jgi:hypothetical protein